MILFEILFERKIYNKEVSHKTNVTVRMTVHTGEKPCKCKM